MCVPMLRTLFLIAALAGNAAARTTDSVNQQVDIAPGGKLVVDVDFGNVDIAAGDENHADVQAERRLELEDETREREYLADAPITVTKEGNTLIVRARSKNHDGIHCSGNCSMDARYTVRVPKNFDADLRTGGGSITVGELIGTVKADTSGGKLRFNQLRGALNGRTSGGNVDVKGCDGPLNVATSGGAIDAAGGSGRIDARTSGGSIAVQDFSGDTNVETSGGKLTLVNINGSITGRTAGGSVRATLAAPVPGDVKLETAAGSIDIGVPANAGFNVDASASVGHVSTELPFNGDRGDRDTLRGTINGGGKSLQLRSGAGSIRIHAAGHDEDEPEHHSNPA